MHSFILMFGKKDKYRLRMNVVTPFDSQTQDLQFL